MKKVISVSLGTSKRDYEFDLELAGEKINVKRIGTDGDKEKARNIFLENDGKVDAFGLGGASLFFYIKGRVYWFRDMKKMVKGVTKTPIADGAGMRETLERRVIHYINEHIIPLKGKTALIPTSVDRYGMTEALAQVGAKLLIGDLVFGLGLPIVFHSLKTIDILSYPMLPIITALPMDLLYPTGKKEEENTPKYAWLFKKADIIAGDFLFIRRYMPKDLSGKIIITNTTTPENVEEVRERGAKYLITTTPRINGRSFGTNVVEAIALAIMGKKAYDFNFDEYNKFLDAVQFKPDIIEL